MVTPLDDSGTLVGFEKQLNGNRYPDETQIAKDKIKRLGRTFMVDGVKASDERAGEPRVFIVSEYPCYTTSSLIKKIELSWKDPESGPDE